VVAGRYELLDPVGHGAMGTVWRARDLRLDREVAVKEVCLPGPMTSQDRSVLRERSLREARVAARLTHPGVVTVHDVAEAEGSPWIIMELVPSRSLSQVLAEDGPLSPAQAAAMGMTLLEALGSAHAAGVVHRDVKPGNILVTPEGRAVLTDFGIATLHGDPRLTQAGMVMGTPGFCAPERIRGEPASPASDLWSLGATLYAAVEGRGPFEGQGSAMAVLANIVHADPPPATRAGPLEPVILALMKRDPAARPNAAGARRMLATASRGCGAGTGVGDGAQDSARIGVMGAGVLGAGVTTAAVAGAGARGPGGAGGGGNGATPDGGLDEPGIAGGTRPASDTRPLPALLARDDAAFAGLPPAADPAPAVTASPLPTHASPAALVPASTLAASGTAPVSSAPLSRGDQSPRPGRHRRALLFGGRAR
jgi:eukaryotic-like serine/threonine-protein kinase